MKLLLIDFCVNITSGPYIIGTNLICFIICNGECMLRLDRGYYWH